MINKIKKLFALASNASSQGNESENAMRMANKLLEKHAISMLDLSDQESVGVTFMSPPDVPWVRVLCNSIAKLYSCKVIRDPNWENSKMILIGTESNRITAEIVINQLIDQITKESKGKGNAFRNGAADSLYQSCMTMIRERKADKVEAIPGTGLVPLDIITKQLAEIDDWMKKHMPNTTTSRSNTRSSAEGRAYGKGLNAGARVGSSQRALS